MKPARVLFFAWGRLLPRARSHLMSLGMTWEIMGRNGFLRVDGVEPRPGYAEVTNYRCSKNDN
ncbi:MAG: hypothetical protein AAFX07_17930, partial [Pseudomonadota bacterium]